MATEVYVINGPGTPADRARRLRLEREAGSWRFPVVGAARPGRRLLRAGDMLGGYYWPQGQFPGAGGMFSGLGASGFAAKAGAVKVPITGGGATRSTFEEPLLGGNSIKVGPFMLKPEGQTITVARRSIPEHFWEFIVDGLKRASAAAQIFQADLFRMRSTRELPKLCWESGKLVDVQVSGAGAQTYQASSAYNLIVKNKAKQSNPHMRGFRFRDGCLHIDTLNGKLPFAKVKNPADPNNDWGLFLKVPENATGSLDELLTFEFTRIPKSWWSKMWQAVWGALEWLYGKVVDTIGAFVDSIKGALCAVAQAKIEAFAQRDGRLELAVYNRVPEKMQPQISSFLAGGPITQAAMSAVANVLQETLCGGTPPLPPPLPPPAPGTEGKSRAGLYVAIGGLGVLATAAIYLTRR